MSLEEKLAELRQASAAKMPPEVKKIAQRATEDLRNSGILDRVISPGTQMPEWTLASHTGENVSSQNLLRQGAVVLSIYRGLW